MQSNYHFYEPAFGHRLAHDPFNAIIAPRPIGWISSKGRDGNINLAPYSFFNAFNYTPPIIGFSSIGYKDSVRNIEQKGEFCWNLVTQPLAEKMNQTSASVDTQVDEFELAGLEKMASKKVSVPHVAESPVVMECKKTQIVQLADKRGHPCNSWIVLGEVVGVHIREDMLVDGVFQTTVAQPVLRGGGKSDYFTVREENRFEMMRP